MDAETVATYDRIAPAFADQWWSTRLTSHMDRFVSGVRPGGAVVDLGCGPGRDTEWLGELGFSPVVGMDASMGMLVEARGRVGDVAVVRGDLVSLPFASSSADGAWICASLLHLLADEAAVALSEVVRVLRPGGALYCGVQLGEGTSKKSSASGDRRFTFWSPDSFSRLVADAGFVDVSCEVAASPDAPGVSWVGVHASAGTR